MMERRLQRKFESTELPAVLAEGLLCLHGAGVELSESVFSLDDTGTKHEDGDSDPNLENFDIFYAQPPDTGRGVLACWRRANRDVDVRRLFLG